MRRHERNHAAVAIGKASFTATAIARFSMSTAPGWGIRVSEIFDRRSQRHPAVGQMRLVALALPLPLKGEREERGGPR